MPGGCGEQGAEGWEEAFRISQVSGQARRVYLIEIRQHA